ncbi:GNVR domain-containing protein [Aeromicrobium sp. UC242_57]|uniref:GNVR domain-containing protein n=1 Tax=Aeromicrobium sp. UC242_57 TaxID=3374624 RepID=UPI0037AF54AA
MSEEFVAYVAELETPPGKDEATIKATVVDPASQPTAPVSPNPGRNIALGLVLGLLVGAGIAVLRRHSTRPSSRPSSSTTSSMRRCWAPSATTAKQLTLRS